MRRLAVLLSFGLLGLATAAVPAYAAGSPPSSTPTVTWQQHDAAVYVVSTLNLLRTPSGQLLIERLNVARFDVYADLAKEDLYFIQLRSSHGGLVGVLAYQMGWAKPEALSRSTSRLGIERASRTVWRAYRADHKQLIGSFTSTIPGQ